MPIFDWFNLNLKSINCLMWPQNKCSNYLIPFMFDVVAKNMHTCAYTFVRVYVYCLCVYVRVFMCVFIFMYMCARISTCICICMCKRIHVCNGVVHHTRTHTHAHTRQSVLWPAITSKRNGRHSSSQGYFEQRWFHEMTQLAKSSSLDMQERRQADL